VGSPVAYPEQARYWPAWRPPVNGSWVTALLLTGSRDAGIQDCRRPCMSTAGRSVRCTVE
jgi:hypothetical protein